MSRTNLIISWIARLTAAIIMLQTLFFKFTAAPESVYIFTTLGLEPTGRIGIGVLELITSFLLLLPRTIWLGAVLGIGLMAGAIFSHLTQLGIAVEYEGKNDGGSLFFLAVAALLACVIALWIHRKEIPLIGKMI